MNGILRIGAALAASGMLAATAAAHAAVPVVRLGTDLKPLIRAASGSPAQFAVPIPHRVSAASGGRWTYAHGEAVWHYAVEVPTAVSLSFHASPVALPPQATLVVRGARTTVSYGPSAAHRGELWSRVQPGAALEFTLTVPAAARAQVRFALVSLQAGYRSLGAGVADHPYYRQLKALAAPADNTGCITNYQCKATAANAPAAAATVALLVQNQFECTGTLMNDVPGDNAPYLLTARHCITGKVGIADQPVPAAQATSVYWDAVTPCGAALGSIYDPNIPTQTGAQSLVEQQDAWLIRLDVNPVVSDAQFAGFDASGASFSGGYTVHHAEGNDKQYTGWFGQPAKANAFAGFSPFLETVNQVGNIAPGASGSGLFNPANHLVGSLTYGRDDGDPTGYQSCPVASPPAPDGSNGAADFTALAAVWNSTADTTSSTGTATLKSVLDPAGTGTLVTASAPVATVSFAASTNVQVYGQPLELTWSASGATGCTATGGLSGDGWSGSLASTGSRSLTESSSDTPVDYTLTCSYGGARTARAVVTVTWGGPTPQLSLTATPGAAWTSRPVTLSWNSNVAPCSLTGGTLALQGLPGSGSTITTSSAAGDVTYMLSCGPDSDRGVAATLVQFAAPGVIFEANGTDRLLGEVFTLNWESFADGCTAQGGAPGDGWAGNSFTGTATPGQFSPQVSTAGTYTYTLVCSAGALTAQQSVTATFESNAPYVTATLDPGTVAFSGSPADYSTLTWNSNLSSCATSSSAQLDPGNNDPLGLIDAAQGSQSLAPPSSGTFTITVTCTSVQGAATSSASATLTVTPAPPPTALVSITPATVFAGQAFTVSWTSTGATYCSRQGGLTADESWPALVGGVAGAVTEVGADGNFTFTVSCFSIDPSESVPTIGQALLQVTPLTATFTSSSTALDTGGTFTLTWNAPGASGCTASGGGADGQSWSGALAPSGSLTQTATTAGTFIYELTCNAGGAQTTDDVSIKVTAPASGGGGGGALGIAELYALALGAVVRRRYRHRQAA
ncbi:MAG TPA: hypothetical protein VL994_03170 [Steroidobacteraceae bacterium]|nr:hypothetical protein [Steroidobacteraceae bacterium]